MNTLISTQVVEQAPTVGYHMVLAVSSDSLVIMTRKKELVEIVILGNDPIAYLCEASTEDDFLDSLMTIKNMLLVGINPLPYIPGYESFKNRPCS
jgi:hypothetical protein